MINYEPLGNHIELVDIRNRNSVTDEVLGINIDKFFMPSVANVIGTDLSKYKLISKGLFACNPMHVGRDERLPVALYDKEIPALVSPAYFMFRIIDNRVLNEEYLMMWFQRQEFDRLCWLRTDGSVRGGITWNVGFTGTPIDPTIRVFGDVVDAYTMTEAVDDGITVNLVYEGRAAKVTLDSAKVKEIENYYNQCAEEGANEYQIEESKKAVAHLDVILGDPDRLRAVASDFIRHYEGRVLEGATVAGKAMFVCANRKIAYNLYKLIIEMRPEWGEKKLCPDGVEINDADKKTLKPIEMVRLVMTRNKDDEPELFNMLGTKDDRKELDRQFKNIKSNFKIQRIVDHYNNRSKDEAFANEVRDLTNSNTTEGMPVGSW